MSSKEDSDRLYRSLPPRDKARLWFGYLVEGTQVPVYPMAGMTEVERTEFNRGRFTLNEVHMFGNMELWRIQAELTEVYLRLELLDQLKWILGFVGHLKRLLDVRAKEPYTASEYDQLLEKYGQELMPLDELVTDLLAQAGVYPSPDADTDKEYLAAWTKKEKEVQELVASGRIATEQDEGEACIRWGDWCRVSGEDSNPLFGYFQEARVFPDEMANLVEEMRKERAVLRWVIDQPFHELMKDGGSAMNFMLTSIAPDLPPVPSGPLRRLAIFESLQDHFSNKLRDIWRHLASLKRVFERIRDEEFGGHDIIDSSILERLEQLRSMASLFSSELAVAEDAVEADEDYVDEICRGLAAKV